MSGNRDSARWCEVCQTHGNHHTDRHPSDPSATPRMETPSPDLQLRAARMMWTSWREADGWLVPYEVADRVMNEAVAAAVREERERLAKLMDAQGDSWPEEYRSQRPATTFYRAAELILAETDHAL